MTVSNSTARNDYTGNGTTTVFPVTFRFLQNSHLQVLRTVISTNATTELILGSPGADGFSATGAGQPGGGTVTVVTAPGNTTERLSILRNMPFTQGVDYIANDAFPADSHERALDERVMENQQLREITNRAIVLPSQTAGVSTELPGPQALNLLRWKADLSGLENAAPPAIATVADGAVVDATVSPIAGIKTNKLSFTDDPYTTTYLKTQSDINNGVEVSVMRFISPSQHAAIRDGSTTYDATSDINSALAGTSMLYFPRGTYLTSGLTWNRGAHVNQARIRGDRNQSTIKKIAASSAPLLKIGDATATAFQANMDIQGLVFDGLNSTTEAAVRVYDMVRGSFRHCRFMNSTYGLHLFGGISLTLDDCVAGSNTIGLRCEKFSSMAGGGYPNLIRVRGGEYVDNSQWGVWFDHGNLLVMNGCDVEGNGTTLAATEGGIYIGPNIGEAVFASDPNTPGLVTHGCWIEGNKGVAGILMEGGRNSISDTWFFSQAANVTNDIKITGGRYTVFNAKMSFAKAANLLETAGALSGNLIENTVASTISVDAVKTMIINGTSFPFVQFNGARTSVFGGLSAPFFQNGSDSTGVNPTINFPTAFKTGTTPKVHLSVVNNSSTTIDIPEAYNITATQFTIRKKSYDGAVIGTVNYQVDWIAEGEALNT